MLLTGLEWETLKENAENESRRLNMKGFGDLSRNIGVCITMYELCNSCIWSMKETYIALIDFLTT